MTGTFSYKHDARFSFTASCLSRRSVILYLQLFVTTFGYPLPPVVCHDVRFSFTASCFSRRSVILYRQLFFTTFGYPLPPVVCHDVRLSFTSSCLLLCSCLIYVICVCWRVGMSNTYCVVFLFCFSSPCVPYVTSFSGLSILIVPSVFSNVNVYF